MGRRQPPADEQLRLFIERASSAKWPTNAWIYSPELDVYVRKGGHLLDTVRTCLDIANIGVREHLRGKKIFSRFIAAAHAMNPWEATYIENTNNPILRDWCVRHDWQPAGSRLNPLNSFYLLKVKNDPQDRREEPPQGR